MDRLDTLERLAAALAVPLTAEARARFAAYRRLLLDWNQRINLTRVTDPDEIEIKLFADALPLVPWIDRLAGAAGASARPKLVDVGSGAGLPGLPLKIVRPQLDIVLIEATGKKARFIQTAIDELGLTGARAIHGRSEELAHDPALRGRFDVVTARAVARLPALVELCQPFCRPGGLGLFPKGRDAESEAREASRALQALQASLRAIEPAPLSELEGSTLVVIEQHRPAPKRYPRPAGVPAKNPL